GHVADRCSQRELIAGRAEARDRSERHVRKERLVAEWLPGGDVREVQLDERDLHGEQGVTQRDARMRERGRIEQDYGDSLVASLVDAFDEVGLRVALEGVEL